MGWVLLVPQQDFITGIQLQAIVDDVVGFAGIAHQGDLVGADIELCRHQAAGPRQHVVEFATVVK